MSTGTRVTGGDGAATVEHTTCVIAGCGPAGAMLGLLLARAGVQVTVLEKHGDFLRDFRGDTIHASTLRLLDQLGLSEAFEALPHEKVPQLNVMTDEGTTTFVDFTTLRGPFPYIAMVPQWDFLDLLTTEAARYPTFTLHMNAEATDVVEMDGKISGVRYRASDGSVHEVRAMLTVATDGRHSRLRDAAALRPVEFGSPMDVLWLRLSRRDDDPGETMGRLSAGHFFVVIDRGTHWQIADVITKGAYEQLRARGIAELRADIARLLPFLADRVDELGDWDDVSMLRVRIDRLRRWHRPGLLVIGDAAHAMSPVGGVGINLAVQDAVAAANLLTEPLRRGRIDDEDLARVRRRRWWPTAATQAVQRVMQRAVIRPTLEAGSQRFRLPAPMRVVSRFAPMRRIPAWFVAEGVRPEHVRVEAREPAASYD